MIYVIVFIVLSIFDLITTSIGLLNGYPELNPVVGISLIFGIWGFAIFKILVTVGVAWFFYCTNKQKDKKIFSQWVNAILDLILFAVVINNFVVILK